MRGKASADFLFDAEPERSLQARLRKAKRDRLEAIKENQTSSESERDEIFSIHSEHSDSEAETMAAPVERLLGDYGGANAPTGRMTIVNQPVYVAHFQLHPATIRQLEKKPFSGRINEDANKHLQRFLTMTTSLKIEGHSEEAKKLNFVNGLKLKTKQLIDTVAGGSTNFKTATEIKKIIDAIAANEHLELYDRSVNQPEGLVDLKLSNQVVKMEDQIAAEVERRLKQMALEKQTVAQVQPAQPSQAVNCEICGGPHFAMHCVVTAQQVEEINFLKQNNPYSNTYNPGWKNHPNFAWKDQQGNVPKQGIAQQLASPQQPGALPSATIPNPKDHNNVSAIITRSGKAKEAMKENAEGEEPLLEVDLEIKENEVEAEELVVSEPVTKEKEVEPKPTIKLPFPTRNKKKGQHEKNFEKFLEMFKKIELNIPVLEALEQMPTYAKFMKDIISKKRTTDRDPIILTETCSAILQGMKIPVKKKDRGSVTIPCTIGDRSFKKALIDLGASVSLMPLSIYKRLGIGKVQDTRMTLQFADHSVKRPYGIVEDVLVKIDKFVFPVDFVILEMPEDEEIPIILGRPFLET
ncbi:uncharacterized protein LOC131633204 [Vicia villosa]|uniref:uncharacterized protein LOC131633204 n=1 Tax=Vicia villosa TaxID=3911 RepID=UPI00273B2877|nr:uncharacterized protein LOC131633204 [Vicia villosa]